KRPGQPVASEEVDRPGSEKLPRATRRDHDSRVLRASSPGREARGELAVGDPGVAAEAVRGNGFGDLPRERFLAAEIPGRPAGAKDTHPRPQHLNDRAELLHRRDDPAEGARLAAAGRFVRPVRAPYGQDPGWAARAPRVHRAARTAVPRPAARPSRAAPPAAPGRAAAAVSSMVTVPSGAGSHSHRRRGRPAAPRPSAITSARQARRLPCPWPIPAQNRWVTRSLTGAPSHSPAAISTPPPRRAAPSSRRRAWASGRSGGR